jgi:hypothetical protein
MLPPMFWTRKDRKLQTLYRRQHPRRPGFLQAAAIAHALSPEQSAVSKSIATNFNAITRQKSQCESGAPAPTCLRVTFFVLRHYGEVNCRNTQKERPTCHRAGPRNDGPASAGTDGTYRRMDEKSPCTVTVRRDPPTDRTGPRSTERQITPAQEPAPAALRVESRFL